jgi:hypothetical protein
MTYIVTFVDMTEFTVVDGALQKEPAASIFRSLECEFKTSSRKWQLRVLLADCTSLPSREYGKG